MINKYYYPIIGFIVVMVGVIIPSLYVDPNYLIMVVSVFIISNGVIIIMLPLLGDDWNE
jgi:hypothetical protein